MKSPTFQSTMLLRNKRYPFGSHLCNAPLPASDVFSLQDIKSATEFYEDKVKQLGTNIQDLEGIVQNKTNSLRLVEEGEF